MQLTLDFSPSITTQYKSLRQALIGSVARCKVGQNTVAGDCDMSPSELSRQLAGGEGRKLDVDDFERILEATQDPLPIYYLIAKFLPNEEQRRASAVSELVSLMPRVEQLLSTLQPTKGRR